MLYKLFEAMNPDKFNGWYNPRTKDSDIFSGTTTHLDVLMKNPRKYNHTDTWNIVNALNTAFENGWCRCGITNGIVFVDAFDMTLAQETAKWMASMSDENRWNQLTVQLKNGENKSSMNIQGNFQTYQGADIRRFLKKRRINEDFGFYSDIPNEEWLKSKQKYASDPESHPEYFKMLQGAITGSMGGRAHPMLFPVSLAVKTPGARDESRTPGEWQYDELFKQVEQQGFDNKNSAILIGVNHLGKGYIIEGNTRTAIAAALSIDYLYAEVRYWNGGERVDGPYAPDRLAKICKPG